jgi:hypothetical protein
MFLNWRSPGNKPGRMVWKIDQSSSSEFSIGVPLSAKRFLAEIVLTATAVFVV